jgi:hypothetical protein
MISLKPGYRFTRNKRAGPNGSWPWHYGPDQLVGVVCNGTPRGDRATELPDDAELCPKCWKWAPHLLVGYVRRCACGKELDGSLPYDVSECDDCRYAPVRRAIHHAHSGTGSYGSRTTSYSHQLRDTRDAKE